MLNTRVTIAHTPEIVWTFDVAVVLVCGVYLWSCPKVMFTTNAGRFTTHRFGLDENVRVLEVEKE